MQKKTASNFIYQSGQIGLVVVLISVVILLIGLSAAKRATQQTEISTEEQESARVFDAAESGAEAGLADVIAHQREGTELPGTQQLTLDGAEVDYKIVQKEELDMFVPQGQVIELPLAGSDIVIEWAEETDCSSAALLISVYSDDGSGNYYSKHYGIDGCDTDCNLCSRDDNNFEDDVGGASTYNYKYTLAVGADDLFARVRPIYNDTKLYAENLPAPAQFAIFSQATNTQAGDETQAVLVEAPLETAPAFMDYVLINGAGGISNN